MTDAQLKSYLNIQMELLELSPGDKEKYIDFCITSGKNDLWNCYGWSFRTRQYDITTDGSQEFTMPEDFEGIASMVEKGSQEGNDIDIYSKEEFDSIVPKPSAHATSYPSAAYFRYDRNVQRWLVGFFPTPTSGITISCQIATREPGSVSSFPQKSEAALIASCLRFLHKSGSGARNSANYEYKEEVRKLQVSDQAFKGRYFKMKDDTETMIRVDRPWL